MSLVKVPARIRVLMVLALSACLAQMPNALSASASGTVGWLVTSAFTELVIGLGFALAFHAAFGALYLAGRVLDIQSGFGLAMVVDPANRSQSPLIGTLLVYSAAATFFMMGGHLEMLELIATSVQAIPIGSGFHNWDLDTVSSHLGLTFGLGMAAVGGAILTLLLVDVAIAFLSRSLPQMNVLLLGFQAKTATLILVLALTTGLLSPMYLKFFSSALNFMGQVR